MIVGENPMPLSASTLSGALTQAGQAAAGALSTAGKDLQGAFTTFVVPELQKIAAQIVSIEERTATGLLTEDAAKFMLAGQCDHTQSTVAAVSELTIFEVQNILNAALGAVRDVVNGAVHFALIP